MLPWRGGPWQGGISSRAGAGVYSITQTGGYVGDDEAPRQDGTILYQAEGDKQHTPNQPVTRVPTHSRMNSTFTTPYGRDLFSIF